MKLIKRENRVLITGAAGFIGASLSKALLEKGMKVIGFDALNDYYDVNLKMARLKRLTEYSSFIFIKGDLENRKDLQKVFEQERPSVVVNLAAQAGVRYSIDHPDCYVQTNLVGFFHLLELCRHYKISHLVYASSSSVYGANDRVPFSVEDKTDWPVSLYAATKKANELMAYAYSSLYQFPVTGLRFFTVYGPWGRPDMAYFSFADAMMEGRTIKVFNYGDMYRDFTYIDDIVEGVCRVLECPPETDKNGVRAAVYNIGNHKSESLMEFIHILEKKLGKKAVCEFLPIQKGDVYRTCADISEMEKTFGFFPKTTLEEGLGQFADWYLSYRKNYERMRR